MISHTLSELADIVGASLTGDASYNVTGLADLRSAVATDISFVANSKYSKYLAETKALAVVMREQDGECYTGNKLIVDDPYVAYAQLSAVFETRQKMPSGVHPSAFVDKTARLGAGVAIGANAFIGANACIGENTEIHPGVSIADNANIGDGCVIFSNVAIYHHVIIGNEVIVHANTTIGSDGFGYAPTQMAWQKIHQIGAVIVGDRVEIGANTSIDRGALSDTRIGDDVIIDNQVHIAHNVEIGDGTAIAGCVGIAGSTKIGKRCQLAGFVAVAGHIEVADGTVFLGGTIVTKGNSEGGVFASALPVQPAGSWRRNSIRYRHLDQLFHRVKQLEKGLDTE